MTDTPTPSRDDLAALMPCIWCGSTIVDSGKEVSRPYLWHVYCCQCDCSGPTNETEAEAIAAWNRRAPSAPVEVAGLVERLRGQEAIPNRSEVADALEASHAASAAKDAEIARLTAKGRDMHRRAQKAESRAARLYWWVARMSKLALASKDWRMVRFAEAAVRGSRSDSGTAWAIRYQLYRSELDASTARAERAEAALAEERLAHTGTIKQRDFAEAWADKLAYAIGGDAIGEHSSINNPWQNALSAHNKRRGYDDAAL